MTNLERSFLIGILIGFVALLQGCKDASDVGKTTVGTFPLQRTVTDSKGRELTATFLAKSGNKVALRRTSDRKEFILTLDALSEFDGAFLRNQPDAHQEKISAIEKKTAKDARLVGRQAMWHNDIENAKREAATLDIPLCLFFVRSTGDLSDPFNRFILSSTEFRQWASQNVVLCLYYRTPTKKGLNGITAQDTRKLSTYYKVGAKTPSTVIINPDGTKRSTLSGYDGGNTQSYIKLLQTKL